MGQAKKNQLSQGDIIISREIEMSARRLSMMKYFSQWETSSECMGVFGMPIVTCFEIILGSCIPRYK